MSATVHTESESGVLLVCGFGRCGSSLMMQMLRAGGVPTIGEFPDFEDARTCLGQMNLEWLGQQHGQAVKVLDPHKCPRMDGLRRIAIWIDRDPAEQAKSHAKFMAATMGIAMSRANRRAFESSFRRERLHAMRCASRDQDRLFRTTFEMLVESPSAVLTTITPWLSSFGFALDSDRAKSVVRPRGRKCLPTLPETELLSNEAIQGDHHDSLGCS